MGITKHGKFLSFAVIIFYKASETSKLVSTEKLPQVLIWGYK